MIIKKSEMRNYDERNYIKNLNLQIPILEKDIGHNRHRYEYQLFLSTPLNCPKCQ